jgi:GTPase involved in cell partitioning and DNA repair
MKGGKNEVKDMIKSIKQTELFRNKVFHGVFIYHPDFADIKIKEINKIMLYWISTVQKAMQHEIGYDGLGNIRMNSKVKKHYRFKKGQKNEAQQYLNNFKFQTNL